jgi:hypothetical protein
LSDWLGEVYGLVAVPSPVRGRALEPSPLASQTLWSLTKTRVPALLARCDGDPEEASEGPMTPMPAMVRISADVAVHAARW